MQINVLSYFEDGALKRAPTKVAIVDQGRSYTFAEIERYSKRCATLILRRLDSINQPIAVYMKKSATSISCDLGIAYSGNIYANLDVKTPSQRLRTILERLAPPLVITSPDFAPQLQLAGLSSDRILEIDNLDEDGIAIDGDALLQRLKRIIDTDPLCIIHTSGSTGIPKGVVLSHRSTIDFMDWCFDCFAFDGTERIGSLSPFFFDIFTLELHLCLAKGASLVLIPEAMGLFPAQLIEFVSTQAISFIFWVPSVMVMISNQDLLGRFDLSSLRRVFFAGEVLPVKHLNRWRKALPAATFVNLYGPIEITVDCTYFVVDRDFGDDEFLPIGIPCRNTDILILNADNGLCATGERGELCVRGGSLALGYWNAPERTAEAFVQNPLNRSYPELIYRTGDLAYRNERGEIIFLGRADYQIKHMGYRIELPEIEHHAMSVEGIANACVLYNREAKEITLYYESRGADVTPSSIRSKLSAVLPKYMLPTAFQCLEEMPRNPNGKIDRLGLAQRMKGNP